MKNSTQWDALVYGIGGDKAIMRRRPSARSESSP
jgi:hypothetical protein